MKALDDVKHQMSFMGWLNGGDVGSVKIDAENNVIARHGEITWISDMLIAMETAEYAALVAEIERREARKG